MIPTPHIEIKEKADVAKTVLMPGDPLRAEYIANHYLSDVKKINTVRNMYGFTGLYKGKSVTVMGSGMGMPSIGIYSYELFAFYDVDNIIRIGSAGSYKKEIDVYDVIIARDAYSESSFARVGFNYTENIQAGSKELNRKLNSSAKKLGYKVFNERIHSSDVFYRNNGDVFTDVVGPYNTAAVEMESFALFANARYLHKNAACILTISDSFISHKVTTSMERQESFNKMMEIALETAIQ